MRTGTLHVRREAITSSVAAGLLIALNAELTLLYPEEGATHFGLDVDEVAEGRGAFVVAYARGEPVGCGAIRRLDANTAEIKRMYVAPQARGQGIGRAVLGALEDEARRLNVDRILLETGTRQVAALALYETSGFVPVPAFGAYVGSPSSLCLEQRLRRS